MSLDENAKPYGLSDIKLTSFDGVRQVDLPAAIKLAFKERIKSAEGVGDDKLDTIVSVREGVEWELEATGLPLEALALMYGTQTSTSGDSPDQIKTLEHPGAVRLTYFKIYGKSLGEGDDDIHCIIYKAKITDGLDAPLAYGELQKAKIKGMAIDDGVNGIYDWVQEQTADDLPGTTAEPPAFTLSSVPADDATGVLATANMVLTFSNALKAHAENGITLIDSNNGAPVDAVITINSARKVVTIDPVSSLAGGPNYLIVVTGVVDVYGQSLGDTVISFVLD